MKRPCIGINGFLLVAFAIALSGCATQATTVGLKPIYPETVKRKDWLDPSREERVFMKIDTLEPTFRWEPFPRKKDSESKDPEVQKALRRIKDITYDLEIFRAENGYPAKLIYSKEGITGSFHKIETPLEPCTKYYWSVRARFNLDGRTRVTGWSVGLLGIALSWFSPYAPNPYFYWFQTPCPESEAQKNRKY